MRMRFKTGAEKGDQWPKQERFESSNISHDHQRNIVMEQAKTKFFWNRLVIWGRKKRLIHLDAGVGNKRAAGKYGKAAAENEKEWRSEIFHADGTNLRIFTGSPDSIRHRAPSGSNGLA
jgi:hypothetical protein